MGALIYKNPFVGADALIGPFAILRGVEGAAPYGVYLEYQTRRTPHFYGSAGCNFLDCFAAQ